MGKRHRVSGAKTEACIEQQQNESRKLQDGLASDFAVQRHGPVIVFRYTSPSAQHHAFARVEAFYESKSDAQTYLSLQAASNRRLCANYQAFNLPTTALHSWLQAMWNAETGFQKSKEDRPEHKGTQGWWHAFTNPHESSLLAHLSQAGWLRGAELGDPAAQSYLVSASDESSIPHEALHALYFLHAGYRDEVQRVWDRLSKKCQSIIQRDLALRGYGEHVWVDEFQAYVVEDVAEFGNRAKQECNEASLALRSAQKLAWSDLGLDRNILMHGA